MADPAYPSVERLREKLIALADEWDRGTIDRRSKLSHLWADGASKALREAAAALAPASAPRCQRCDWLEGTALPHARKQENANGFQKGWHAALSRVSEGGSLDELNDLVPEPCANPDDTLPLSALGTGASASAPQGWQPLSLPVWKCKACGCLWRDNLDDTVSLLNTHQRSCISCEHSPTKEACAPFWLSVMVPAPPTEERP